MRIKTLLVLILIVGMAACGSKSPTEPSPSCSATISPANQTFDGNGGSGAVTVSMAAGCSWMPHQAVAGLPSRRAQVEPGREASPTRSPRIPTPRAGTAR